ncbi:MAG: universal stress protein [Gemmatimonadota bacterium]
MRNSEETTVCFDRILVGVDFRPPGLSAARWAAAHFARARAIELAHVIPPPEPGLWARHLEADALPQFTSAARPSRHEALVGLASSLGPAPIATNVLVGQPASRLTERARSFDADLVILGRSTVDGVRGRTIERLVRQLEVPVLAVGCGEQSLPVQVLAAIDTAAIGVAVVKWGLALAKHFGVKLTLLHVVPGAVDPGWERSMERWLKQLGGTGAVTAIVPSAAGVGAGILEVAAARGAGLLIVGRSGGDALGAAEIGTATGIVLRRAQIPILVVPKSDALPRCAARQSTVLERSEGSEPGIVSIRAGASVRLPA